MRHRQQQGLEPVHLRAPLQERDRLFAIRRVVIDEGDVLALELIEPAFLFGDVLKQDVGRTMVTIGILSIVGAAASFSPKIA
jgi:hypothetical protein